MTDYRFLAKRTDAFIELLSDSLIGWNTCFTDEKQINGKWCIPLKKAPQSFCYVETGGCNNGSK